MRWDDVISDVWDVACVVGRDMENQMTRGGCDLDKRERKRTRRRGHCFGEGCGGCSRQGDHDPRFDCICGCRDTAERGRVEREKCRGRLNRCCGRHSRGDGESE